MAVELRCPKCKAKLRLKAEPEPDTEIECAKCGTVFAADEHIVHAGAAEDEPPAKKAKKSAGGDKPKSKGDAGEKKAPPKPAGEFKRKKRKGKKRKSSKGVLIAVVTGLVIMISSVAGVLIWFFTKKSTSQEMISYLPSECEVAFGLNVGHLTKYPPFYKTISTSFGNSGFREAGDQLAKVLGSEKMEDVVDYVVQGAGFVGGSGPRFDATVIKTKVEYDPAVLAKLPGAQKFTLNGVDYYTITPLARLGYPGLRVFGPTNRMVVFCSGNIPEAQFRSMLTGHADNPDATLFSRGGELAKQIVRGTVWQFHLDRPYPPISGTAPQRATGDEDKVMWQELDGVMAGSKGNGYKASVGSREVRAEWLTWHADSEATSKLLKKWREKEWVKDEEKEVPKWFKTLAEQSISGKTALNVVRDGLSFRASGEVFRIRVEAETKLVEQSIGNLVSKFTGSQGGGFGGGGGMPGAPGGGMPGPPPGPGGPKPRQSRLLGRRRAALASR